MMIQTDLFDLTGQAALLTDASSPIGAAAAEALIRHGARVLVGSRSMETIDKTVAHLNTHVAQPGDEPAAAAVMLDVACDQSCDHAVKKAVDFFGRLDILVNIAAAADPKPAFDVTRDECNDLYQTNASGMLRCCQAAGHLFREQHAGCIINLVGADASTGRAESALSASTDGAALALTHSLAAEWATFGVRTNAVAARAADGVAGAVVYLASPAARLVNGQTLIIDAGPFPDNVQGEE